MSDSLYVWTGDNGTPYWDIDGNWWSQSSGATYPDSSDTVIFEPGNYSILYQATAGNLIDEGNITFDGGGDSSANFGTAWVMPGASMTVQDGALQAGTVAIFPGAKLNLGVVPFGGYHSITELANLGGSLISTGNLLIGGPGFVQSGVSTPGEMNLSNGSNDWINLGNVAQGSSVAPVVLDILNETGATLSGDFKTWTPVGGFDLTGFSPATTVAAGTSLNDVHSVGAVSVDASTLGSHLAVIGFGPNAVGIIDNVVK